MYFPFCDQYMQHIRYMEVPAYSRISIAGNRDSIFFYCRVKTITSRPLMNSTNIITDRSDDLM